jgi:hypothetical protein
LSYKQQTTVVNKQQLIQQEGYTMKKTGWIILLAMALSYIPVVGAQEQEQTSEEPFKTTDWRKDFSIAIGTKLWFNEWTTWDVAPIDINFDGVINEFDRFDVTSNEADGYELTLIPALSVKYHEFFVSASYFVDTAYRFPTLVDEFDRREWDVTTGYYLFPPYLALTIGFKQIQRTIPGPAPFGDIEFQVDGPIVGFAGAAPIKWGFSLYTSFAYGLYLLNNSGQGLDNMKRMELSLGHVKARSSARDSRS